VDVVSIDVREPETIETAVAHVLEEAGRIDVLSTTPDRPSSEPSKRPTRSKRRLCSRRTSLVPFA
jgi:hypothetical protein